MTMHHTEAPGIVLALGGGGAAGLAHIGVLQVLGEEGIPVRAVAGTSIGAEIGAFVASGMPVNDLAAIATAFDWKQTLQLFFPDLPTGGLISGVRIVDFLNSWIGQQQIEELAMGYVAIATDLHLGEQVVLDHGDLVTAVRASISIPGIMSPVHRDDRWLVDGGVINPLPFDIARQRFGGPVVAVAVHSSARNSEPPPSEIAVPSPQWPKRVRQLLDQPWMERAPVLREWLQSQVERAENSVPRTRPYWTTRRVLDRVLDIAEAEIIRMRAAASPPDLVLSPAVGSVGVLEFYQAAEAIAAGRHAALENLARIRALLAHPASKPAAAAGER
jgi:NTE family protein